MRQRNSVFRLSATLLVLAATHAIAGAAPPAPPGKVAVKDRPNDNGNVLIITWELSPDDTKAGPRLVSRYEIRRRTLKGSDDSGFVVLDRRPAGKGEFSDSGVNPEAKYEYEVAAVGPDGELSDAVKSEEPTSPVRQWFDGRRGWLAIILVIVCGSAVYFIESARRGRDLKIRKIAGLEAVDEAVGRATEMGRPLLFVPGIMDINDIQTVAGITILGRVAKTAAEYGAKLEVPTSRSLVMTAARETTAAAFLAAGRPDSYREDDIYYLTDEQFAYVAGVTGSMAREKPAACFYMGSFFAESLFLAETGNSIGAIQMAGTAQPSQLPFFVAACDYTLIGEEFFAASAYLSGEPHQMGSLKGQDFGKLIGGTLLIVACLTATLAQLNLPIVGKVSAYIQENVLGENGFRP